MRARRALLTSPITAGSITGRALAVVRPRYGRAGVAACWRSATPPASASCRTAATPATVAARRPMRPGAQLVLSLERLNRIRERRRRQLLADRGGRLLLAQVQAAADRRERFFPLSLGSQGSCQIGGNLSTNAGGTQRAALRHDARSGAGDSRWCWPTVACSNALAALRKDNTGYDIKSLFLGAEGTLGVITAATLKLFPEIRARATALAAVADVRAAVALLRRLRDGEQRARELLRNPPAHCPGTHRAPHPRRPRSLCHALPLVRAVRTVLLARGGSARRHTRGSPRRRTRPAESWRTP